MLFGDSITEQSFASGGWGAALTDRFARQVRAVRAPPLALAAWRLSVGVALMWRILIWLCLGFLVRRTSCCAG